MGFALYFVMQRERLTLILYCTFPLDSADNQKGFQKLRWVNVTDLTLRTGRLFFCLGFPALRPSQLRLIDTLEMHGFPLM